MEEERKLTPIDYFGIALIIGNFLFLLFGSLYKLYMEKKEEKEYRKRMEEREKRRKQYGL